MFAWARFLGEHQVDFRSAGAHNIEVHCPFCGDADPSMHMSISTRGRGWRCFRNDRHSGKSNARLIQALLRCTWEQACRYAGHEPTPSTPDEDVAGSLAEMLGVAAEPVRKQPLDFPPEFKNFEYRSVLCRPFLNYLEDEEDGRGFSKPEVDWTVQNYHLRYAFNGGWAGRIIIPVMSATGQLLTWTARSIRTDPKLRYKTLSQEDHPGAVPTSQLLLGLDLLWNCLNPRALVICEGPFDAMRVSWFGHKLGVFGTCLFGLKLSDDQADLIEQLAARFPKLFLVVDDEAQFNVLGILDRLATIRVDVARLPRGVKDPGELSAKEALVFIDNLLEGVTNGGK